MLANPNSHFSTPKSTNIIGDAGLKTHDAEGRKMQLGEVVTRQRKYGKLSFIMEERKELPSRCRVLEIV
jgi:hypothetical protein